MALERFERRYGPPSTKKTASKKEPGWWLQRPAKKFIQASSLALIVAVFAMSLAAAHVEGLTLAYYCDAAIWLFGVFAILSTDWIHRQSVIRRASLIVGGIIFWAIICIGFGYWEHEYFTEQITLIAGNNKTPEIKCDQNNPYRSGIAFGSNFDSIGYYPFVFMQMDGRPLFVIDKDENGLIIRSLTLYDDNHNTIGTIDNNVIWVPDGIHKIRPNKSTLIIKDHNNDIALAIWFMNKDIIQLQGRFRNLSSPLVIDQRGNVIFNRGHGVTVVLGRNCFEDSPIIQTNDKIIFGNLIIDKVKDASKR